MLSLLGINELSKIQYYEAEVKFILKILTLKFGR